jgi:hypothetical protein
MSTFKTLIVIQYRVIDNRAHSGTRSAASRAAN